MNSYLEFDGWNQILTMKCVNGKANDASKGHKTSQSVGANVQNGAVFVLIESWTTKVGLAAREKQPEKAMKSKSDGVCEKQSFED